MRTPYLITATVAVLLFIVGAGNHTAYGQRRLKVVEQYNVNGAEYQVNPKTATRRIEYLYLYDALKRSRKGGIFWVTTTGDTFSATTERAASQLILPTSLHTLAKMIFSRLNALSRE